MGSARFQNRIAAERWDVLEVDAPCASCSVRGCDRSAHYPHGGAFGEFWLCSRHRPLYREHDSILRCIRAIDSRP